MGFDAPGDGRPPPPLATDEMTCLLHELTASHREKINTFGQCETAMERVLAQLATRSGDAT